MDQQQTLQQLLQEFAKRARTVAGEIQQPPRSNSMIWGMPKADDNELRKIEMQMLSVAKAIYSYLEQRPS
jgi:hypothetical protein